MSEKRYLLTHDEICQLQDIALSALAWESEDNDEMVELKQAEYRAMLESHEYREPDIPITVHDIPHCPRCKHEAYWRRGRSENGEELLRCAGCGNDYRWRKPAKAVER